MEAYRGLYYGDDFVDEETFKKSILIYDELHVFDRPSISVGGKLGSIGKPSPFRQLNQESLQDAGFSVVCHKPTGGQLTGPMHDAVVTDMEDPQFAKVFLREFFGPTSFAWRFLSPEGGYSKGNRAVSGEQVREAMRRIDWEPVDFTYERLETADPIEVLGSLSPEGLQLEMHFYLWIAAHLLNNFLLSTIETAAVPFTDINGYHNLLLAKHERATLRSPAETTDTVFSCLAHTVLDEILSSDALQHCTVDDLLIYRKANANCLNDFRAYLRSLQHQLEAAPFTDGFQEEVQTLLDTEVLPQATSFQKNLQDSWEKLVGALAVRTVGGITGLGMVVLREMPFEAILTAGGTTAFAVAASKAIATYVQERRQITRQNGLAYLLKL